MGVQTQWEDMKLGCLSAKLIIKGWFGHQKCPKLTMMKVKYKMRPKISHFPHLQEKRIACKSKRLPVWPVPVLTVMLPSPPSVSWNWKCCLDSVLSAGTFLTIISTSEPLMRVTSCPSSSPAVSTVTALQFWTNQRWIMSIDQSQLTWPQSNTHHLDQSEASIVTRSPPITAHLDPVLAALDQAGGVLAQVLRHQVLSCNIMDS